MVVGVGMMMMMTGSRVVQNCTQDSEGHSLLKIVFELHQNLNQMSAIVILHIQYTAASCFMFHNC